ncbi:MAG: recombinase family protein [Janthinobacterium lividum]
MNNPNSNKATGAVIVTRVSTGKQIQGTSLEEQVEVCRTKALALNLSIFAEYQDAGVSGGFLLSREGMQKAIADIQAGRADTLITATMSRYSRDTEHQQAIKKAVRAAGGRVVFCDMDFDETPEGDLNFAIQGGFAEYERQSIRKRTMAGRRRRAEQGLQPGRTFAPYGYHVPTNTDVVRGTYQREEAGRYFIVEPQATLVRDMFAWYSEGRFSLAAMARHLNSEGIPPPRGGQHWRESTIGCMLKNTVYRGEAVYGRHQKRMDETRVGQPHALTGKPLTSPARYQLSDDYVIIPCPPLVSDELWDIVQERFRSNQNRQAGNPTRLKMLSGLVCCPECGSSMVYKSERNRKGLIIMAHYTCGKHIKKQRLEGEAFCNAKTYRQSIQESAVVTAVLKAVQNPDWIKTALETYRQAKQMPHEVVDYRKELQAVERSLKDIETKQGAAVKAQIAGIMAGASPDAYAAVFAEIAVERKSLEDKQSALSRASRSRQPSQAVQQEQTGRETILRDVHMVMTSSHATDAEKRALVGRVIEKVTCQKDGADVMFVSGLFGEVCDNTIQVEHPTFQTKPQSYQTDFKFLTACASYLGL